jgi:hypothetical protein
MLKSRTYNTQTPNNFLISVISTDHLIQIATDAPNGCFCNRLCVVFIILHTHKHIRVSTGFKRHQIFACKFVCWSYRVGKNHILYPIDQGVGVDMKTCFRTNTFPGFTHNYHANARIIISKGVTLISFLILHNSSIF